MVALVQSSVTLPIMIFSLLAGVFADNFDRRKVMLIAQSFMLVVSIVLAIMAYEGLLTPWLLLGFTFLIGCGTALHNPSWQASMGDIVSRDELSAAVSLNSMGFNLMRSVGPAAGGAIVAIAGAAAAFAVNALSYVGIITALWFWRPATPHRRLPRERMGSAFSAGLRYVAMSPNLIEGDLSRLSVWPVGDRDSGAVAADRAGVVAGRGLCLWRSAGLFWGWVLSAVRC